MNEQLTFDFKDLDSEYTNNKQNNMITKKDLLEGTILELTEYIITTYIEPLTKVYDGRSDLNSRECIQEQLEKISKNNPPMGIVFCLSLGNIAETIEIKLETIEIKLISIYVKINP